MLPLAPCLKMIICKFLYSFIVAYDRRSNIKPFTPSWPNIEISLFISDQHYHSPPKANVEGTFLQKDHCCSKLMKSSFLLFYCLISCYRHISR